MAVVLAKGTKETVPVEVVDFSGILASIDLASYLPKYDFLNDANTFIYNQQTAQADGLIINCLLDTTVTGPGGLLAIGHYRLFVSFTIGAEVPRLGPVDVYIKDVTS